MARGAAPRLLAYETLVARLGVRRGAPLDIDADAVLARIIPNGSLEQIIYRVDALHWLEDSGVRVMNSPRAIERSVDKFYASALLEREGLATPETVVCERSEDAIAAFREMHDVIVKPLFGSMGLGMVRVADEEVAWRVFRALDAIRGVYYVQRTIDHGGRDIRAFVIGDRVIGAIERRRAARAIGADYAGVDLLPATDGTVYALEVNGIPGWQGVQKATGIDVAGAIVDHLLASMEPC